MKYLVVERVEVEELHVIVLEGEQVIVKAVYSLEDDSTYKLIRTVRGSGLGVQTVRRGVLSLKRHMSAWLDYMALFELGECFA